ncbi:MAG: hypothetical protein WA160_06725 [Pseudobdellovibrio sp.]
MKNTFSKTLICGVIASSFVLVNCQKSPTGRSVKANTPAAGAPTEKALAGTTGQCADPVIAAKEAMSKLIVTVNAQITESRMDKIVSEANKAVLQKSLVDLDKQCDAYLAEFEKLKVETCAYDIQSAKGKTITSSYIKQGCSAEIQAVASTISDKSEVVAKWVKVAAADVVARKAKEGLSIDARLVVSEALASTVKDKFSETGEFLMDGKIIDGANSKVAYDEAVAAADKSLCTFEAFDKDGLKQVDILKVLSLEQKNKAAMRSAEKAQYEISLTSESGGKTFLLKCLIAKKNLQAEFKKVVGSNLSLKETETVKETVKPTEEEKKQGTEESEMKSAANQISINNSDLLKKTEVEIKEKADQQVKQVADSKEQELKDAKDKLLATKKTEVVVNVAKPIATTAELSSVAAEMAKGNLAAPVKVEEKAADVATKEEAAKTEVKKTDDKKLEVKKAEKVASIKPELVNIKPNVIKKLTDEEKAKAKKDVQDAKAKKANDDLQALRDAEDAAN